MPYKTILVHAEASSIAEPRLTCAAELARTFDALLLGLGGEIVKSLGVSDPYGFSEGPWLVAVRERVEGDLKAAQAAFERIAGGQAHEWRVVEDLPAAAMAKTARAADLIVAGGAPAASPALYHDQAVSLGELVLAAGRPVFVVPPVATPFVGAAVIIAWKDTREARRAVADALPLLQRAQTVVVLEICGEIDAGLAEVQTQDVARALGRHGVTAQGQVIVAPDHEVCDLIHAQARARSADLIVAGAYGRSRFSEWAFGGVTRRLLGDPQGYLLLSH